MAFVLLQQEEELPGLRGAFQQLKEITHKHFRLSLSASLGPVVDRFGLLHEACEKALHCLDLEGLMKKGAFLDTEHITAPTYQEKNRNLVDLIERYTQENYGNPDLSLKGISQKFHLSPAYLGKVFKTVRPCWTPTKRWWRSPPWWAFPTPPTLLQCSKAPMA